MTQNQKDNAQEAFKKTCGREALSIMYLDSKVVVNTARGTEEFAKSEFAEMVQKYIVKNNKETQK